MTKPLSTGIKVLDRKLDGGIPAGRVIGLLAPPASQSELFLYEMAAVRPTVYLTTERPADQVRELLAHTDANLEEVTIREIKSADPLTEAKEAIAELRDEATLIVDPMRRLEQLPSNDFRTFLNEVKSRTVETESLAVLHCLHGSGVLEQRDRTEYLVDIIFSLTTSVRGGTVQNTLAIPKFRGGQALPESINLDLTTDVTIDVTRKIA